MYAVVGCSDCRHLWVIEERPETTTCPRCRTTRNRSKRRTFARSQRVNEVRDVRSTLLAKRTKTSTGDQPTFSALATDVADGVISDDRELAAAGIDPKAVADRAEPKPTGSQNNREVIEGAVEAVEPPTERQIIAYATDRGIDSATARRLLEKLAQSGGVVVEGEEYRTA